ncbi:hypothetical protein [Marivita sp. GX14005]|uniref:hypothetical protein n=1 Tax=Marivita sp. GX14005 TaxID=2942276 RepID=UPI0020192B95|nr:hypothetical protein [Marivita sp. GX14005]MCL3881409.1 hypothetical protein [Marivita sp. GX14005]
MSRKFIAAALIVSTAIAGFSATPAKAASEEDIARILGAAATVFILGKAIQNTRDDRDKDRRKKAKHRYRYEDRALPKVVPRHRHQNHRIAPLPRKCVRRIEGGHVARVAMAGCLKRNYRSARALPRHCRMRVETRRGPKRAYALPCLRQSGYRIERSR